MRHDPPEWLADWLAIQVDTASVQQLAAALCTEVHGTLTTHTEQVFQEYAPGVVFGGRNPSFDLDAVRTRYGECLQATVDQLAAYIDASSTLVAAATEIAFRYRNVDELAAANIADVDSILTNALVSQQYQGFGHDVRADGSDGM